MRRRSMFFVSATLLLGILPLAAGPAAAGQISGSGGAKAALLDHRGLKQLRHGDLDAAEHSFRKAVELGPNNPDAYHGLGRVAMRRHDYREALSYLLRARELYARRAAQVDAIRSDVAAELDRHRRSASDQAASFADAGCLTERGVDLWMSSPQSGDETDEPGGVDLRGTPPGLSFRIGTCQLHLGHFEAARTELERELLIAPDNAAAHLNLAVVLLRLDQPAQAFEELDTAVRLGAQEPEGLRSDILVASR